LVSTVSLGCASPASAPDPLAAAAQADDDGPLAVDFAGCREVANVGLAPTASVRPLVPAQFSLAGGDAPATPFVVRTVHCDAVSVAGDAARAADVVQIGAVIVAPDGDGDINNYTLSYDTSDHRLAKALADLGVQARFVPRLEESLQVNADGTGQYRFVVPAPFSPTLTFAGPVGAPSTTPIPFTANWWFASDEGTVKMASSFPQLFTASNGVVLTLPAGSRLATTLGTTTVSSFPVLDLFDDFPSAHMQVTVR
jgi:hypothetical protein